MPKPRHRRRLRPRQEAGKRDRALLALGFAGAFRRSELVALTINDLALVDDGYRVLSGHSLRSGFVTSAVEMNAPILKIVETTRHRSVDMLRVYSRRADLFREHAGAAFL
jgi:integrase